MRDAPGVGLATPQIGESLQLAVIEDKCEYHKGLTAEQLSERQRVPVGFHVIINPQIELLAPPDISFYASSAEFVGRLWFGESSKRVK